MPSSFFSTHGLDLVTEFHFTKRNAKKTGCIYVKWRNSVSCSVAKTITRD